MPAAIAACLAPLWLGVTGIAYATTLYNVAINTSAATGCAGALVMDFTSASSSTNTVTIQQFAHNGTLGTVDYEGGPASGWLVNGHIGPNTTTLGDAAFFNQLTIPFGAFGTSISFTIVLTEVAPTDPELLDQVAIYMLGVAGNCLFSSSDPLLTNTVFAITVTGQSGGDTEVYSPATIQGGTVSFDMPDCGAGGCPFVDTRTARGWQVENSILARSLAGASMRDVYRLKSTPAVINGQVELRIRENENEFSSIDEVSLVAVDHPPDVRAFHTESRVVLGRKIPAARVTTTAGVDVTSLVDGQEDDYFLGEPGDTLSVSWHESRGRFAMQSTADGGGGAGMEGDPKEMESPPFGARRAQPAGAHDASVLASSGMIIQTPDGSGGWREFGKYYPRRYRTETVYDSLGVDSMRLVFVGRHRLFWVGRIEPTAIESSSQSLQLVSASHSRLGGVRAAVAQSGGRSAPVVPGDTLDLVFAATPIPTGQVRDWFIVTTGLYSSDAIAWRDESPNEETLPKQFRLYQNEPNPFRQSTMLRFDLPFDVSVQIDVFDAQGRLVRKLADGWFTAGYRRLEWDQRDESGRGLSPGVYLYRIRAGNFRAQRKMVLLAN